MIKAAYLLKLVGKIVVKIGLSFFHQDENGKTTCTLDPECYAMGTCGQNNICAMAETYGIGAKYITVRKNYMDHNKLG